MTEAHVGSETSPAPRARHISPAAEEYAARTSFLRLLWPVAWLGALVLLSYLLTAEGWHEPAAPTEAHGHSGIR